MSLPVLQIAHLVIVLFCSIDDIGRVFSYLAVYIEFLLLLEITSHICQFFLVSSSVPCIESGHDSDRIK